MGETDWHGLVKGMLKAEIKRRNLTYEQVAEKLAEIGVRETTDNIRDQDQPRRILGCVLRAVSQGNWVSTH